MTLTVHEIHSLVTAYKENDDDAFLSALQPHLPEYLSREVLEADLHPLATNTGAALQRRLERIKDAAAVRARIQARGGLCQGVTYLLSGRLHAHEVRAAISAIQYRASQQDAVHRAHHDARGLHFRLFPLHDAPPARTRGDDPPDWVNEIPVLF